MKDKKLLIYRISYSIISLAILICTILLFSFIDYYIYSDNGRFPVFVIYSIILFVLAVGLTTLLIITNNYKNGITKEPKVKTPKKKNVRVKPTKEKKAKTKPVKEIKAIEQLIKIKPQLTLTETTLKELKIKKIIYYVFLSLTSVFLLISIFLNASIIFSILTFPILIPTIACGIVTIILHSDIKQLKFQLYLNEIINHRDSN